MKKILVLSESYPSLHNIYSMGFIHSRNIEYIKLGVDVTVLSFSSKEDYVYEGVSVVTSSSTLDFVQYDAIVSHAPNLRNHLKIIYKNYAQIKKIFFVFHGHEILFMSRYYPKPYSWEKSSEHSFLRFCYDFFKLKVLKFFLNLDKVAAIYVSEWMREAAHDSIGKNNFHKEIIVNNPINYAFYEGKYNYNSSSGFSDFVTIRPLNGSKYAVDLVVELAKANPSLTFDIYGKGEFFSYNSMPSNVRHINKFIEQKDIPNLLDNYKAAVMPTRLDAQGVMMCEMASYGIPIIVSDLPVCHEMLDGFSNVIFIENDLFFQKQINIDDLASLKDIASIEKFSPRKLASKELKFILS